MRTKCIFAVLLICTMALSASACVAGVSATTVRSCQTRRARCYGNLHARKCDVVLKSSDAHCNIRGLLQFHAIEFRKLDALSPFRSASERVVAPSRPAIQVSSIGSPETDRGPPLS